MRPMPGMIGLISTNPKVSTSFNPLSSTKNARMLKVCPAYLLVLPYALVLLASEVQPTDTLSFSIEIF